MAKNVKLSWTNPGSVSDIDTIEIYRKTGDHTSETNMDTFRSGATLVTSAPVGTAGNVQEYTESNVAANTYTYGAFSKNAGGFGPGDLTDSTIVVT
jgi:hypothetical protein|tara:strand:+ start:485 stop:772 length:288 start_codon:yes stop_codon:yes gene_type:complete